MAPILLVLAVACGPAEPVIIVPTINIVPPVSTTPTSLAKASSPQPIAANTPATASAPAASANPSSEVEARPPGSRVLAETTFVHDGFRTEVSDTLEGEEIRSEASAAAKGKQRVTVSLRNLSRSTDGIQSRATINFAPGLNNFVAFPTAEGPLTLYLHRSGRLGLAPDTGGFT